MRLYSASVEKSEGLANREATEGNPSNNFVLLLTENLRAFSPKALNEGWKLAGLLAYLTSVAFPPH